MNSVFNILKYLTSLNALFVFKIREHVPTNLYEHLANNLNLENYYIINEIIILYLGGIIAVT